MGRFAGREGCGLLVEYLAALLPCVRLPRPSSLTEQLLRRNRLLSLSIPHLQLHLPTNSRFSFDSLTWFISLFLVTRINLRDREHNCGDTPFRPNISTFLPSSIHHSTFRSRSILTIKADDFALLESQSLLSHG
jgi:hypothetical protein